jgi:hypothetical protein
VADSVRWAGSFPRCRRSAATGCAGSASALGVGDLGHRYLWQPAAVDQLMADEQFLPSTSGRGAGGEVNAVNATGHVVWPLTDHLGTVRDLAVFNPQTGTTEVADHRQYSSYGVLLTPVPVAQPSFAQLKDWLNQGMKVPRN